MLPSTLAIAHSNILLIQKINAHISKNGYRVEKELASGIKALRYILREQPNVVILDANFSDISVFEIIKEIRNKKMDTQCILLFDTPDCNTLFLAGTFQVNACVCAKSYQQDLKDALQTIAHGGIFMSEGLKAIKTIDTSLEKLEELTQTEMRILALIGVYKTSTKISEKLLTSVRTVEKHRSNIIKKLQLQHKSFSLNYWAIRHQDIIHSFVLQRVS